jgi:trk system potassium uptake protein
MKRQVVVIGLGRFGWPIATTLYQRGHDVLAIDNDRDLVDDISALVTHAVQADASDESALRDLGLDSYDIGIVAVGSSIEVSVLATLLLKRHGITHVIAKAASPLHGEILGRIGADRVVFPEREMGIQVAHTFGAPQIEDYLAVTDDYGLSRVRVPPAFVGRTLAELDLPARCGLQVVLLRRGQGIDLAPAPATTLTPDDHLVVAGTVDALERLGALFARPPLTGG